MIRFVLALSVALAALARPALADTMSFYIVNETFYEVALELYGKGRVWPGDGKVYAIDPEAKKSIPVECNAGERICYGGWRVGNDRITFGGGPDMQYACEDCCFICVQSSTSTIRLVRP